MSSPNEDGRRSLTKRAVEGGAWVVVGWGASQFIRFAGNLLLTRLLYPELFGLSALLSLFTMGLTLFSDIGIGPSLIQNPRSEDPRFVNTAWTIQVLRGLVLWIASFALAYPMAGFYKDDRLIVLLPVISVTVFIGGFGSTSVSKLNRLLRMDRLLMFDIGCQVASLTVMAVWAAIRPTIWALVAGSIVQSVLRTVWSHFLVPESRDRFAWDPEMAREIFKFGRWVFVSTALTFVSGQTDRLMVAKLVSVKMLGIYSIARTLAALPTQILVRITNTVVFAAVAQRAHRPRPELLEKIQGKRKLLLLVFAPALALSIVGGDSIIFKIYDARYYQAAWMLPIFLLGLWHTVLYATVSGVFWGLGRPQYEMISNGFTFAFILLGIPAAFSAWGMPGLVLAASFSDLPKYIVLAVGFRREGLSFLRQDAEMTLVFVALLAVFMTLRVVGGFGLPLRGMPTLGG